MTNRRRAPRVLHSPVAVERPFPLSAPSGGSERPPEDALDPVERAVAEGRERGYLEGRRQAAAELAGEIDRLRASSIEGLKHLASIENDLIRRHHADVLAVALDAASKIVRGRIEAGDPVVSRALSEAMDALPTASGIRARLHPGDLEIVAREMAEAITRGRLSLVGDASVARGGCLVESPVGNIDATVETAEAVVRAAALGQGAGA